MNECFTPSRLTNHNSQPLEGHLLASQMLNVASPQAMNTIYIPTALTGHYNHITPNRTLTPQHQHHSQSPIFYSQNLGNDATSQFIINHNLQQNQSPVQGQNTTVHPGQWQV